MTPRTAATRRILPGSPFNVEPVDTGPPVEYAVNDRVCHDRHGMGRVTGVEPDTAVVVDFGGGNTQRITLASAKLSKV